MTMSEHAKPLKPGEIRRHTVGIRTFQVMHVAGGGMAQATYRDDTRSTVICTDRDIDAVVRSYAEAIEQAESAAADALNDADDTQFIGAASGELVTGADVDIEQLHAEARVENLLRQRRTTYAAYGDGAFDATVRRMQSSFGLPVTGVPAPQADLTFNTPEGADMALVTGEPTDSALKFYRVRPGYYESNWGHSIERFEALNGNPMTWVILYPGETVGDVSRPTLAEAVAYVEQEPGDAPAPTLAVAASAALAGTFGSTLLRPEDALPTSAPHREPIYPKGTPEYDAYAAELKTELDKWVAGEEPHPYQPGLQFADREPTAPAPEQRCTYGGDCTVHPDAQGLHDFDQDAPTSRVTLALDELATLREQIDYNPYQQDVAQDITDRFNRIEALLRSEAR